MVAKATKEDWMFQIQTPNRLDVLFLAIHENYEHIRGFFTVI